MGEGAYHPPSTQEKTKTFSTLPLPLVGGDVSIIRGGNSRIFGDFWMFGSEAVMGAGGQVYSEGFGAL